MRRSWEVNRRAVLRGTGIAIGLPLLDAMVPGERRARAAGTTGPKRLFLYLMQGGTPETVGTGGGGLQNSLRPKTTGTGYEPTPILQPFFDMKLEKDVTPISNLNNSVEYYQPPPYDGSDHRMTMMAIFTGVRPKNAELPNKEAAISIDQIAANAFKASPSPPPVPFLYLEPHRDYDQGAMSSWSSATSRNNPIEKVSEAFAKVFGDGATDPKLMQKRLAYRKSILHYATAGIGRLRGKLGKEDQTRLDRYLTSIRDLETQIASVEKSGANACAGPGSLTANDSASLPDKIKQLLDLSVIAFQCDRTRVVLLAQAFTSAYYSWLNQPWGWHDVQHADGGPASERDQRYNAHRDGAQWSMKQFAYLVDKLKTTSDAEGIKLIDNSMLALTSEMSWGNGHSVTSLPVVIAGRAGGVAQGRHLAPPSQPIANLWVSLLNAVDVPTDKVGISTGPLDLA